MIAPPQTNIAWMGAVRRAATRLATVSLLVAASCREGGLPMEPNSPSLAPVRLSLHAVVSAAGRSMKVVAAYARTGAPTTLIALDSATVTLTGVETQVAVRLNITRCLADASREIASYTPPGDHATTCLLHLVVTLLDALSQPIDQSVVPPFTVQPGKEATTPPVSLGSVVGSVVLADHAVTLNALGRTAQLSAVVRDVRGAVISPPPVAWLSLDPLVAAVDASSGVVAASAVGTTRVVATSRDRADTAVIVVRQVPASIRLTGPTAPLGVGDIAPVSAVALDSAGAPIPLTTVPVAIAPEDPLIIAVDGGTIRAIRAGGTTVVATGGGLRATSAVLVKPTAIELDVGSSVSVAATVGTTIDVPIIADMSFARGQNVASLSLTITWEATRFDLVATQNGAFGRSGTFFVNSANAQSGSINVSMFDVDGFSTGTPTLFTISLRPRSAGPSSQITATVTAAGDVGGTAIPSDKLYTRSLTVSVP